MKSFNTQPHTYYAMLPLRDAVKMAVRAFKGIQDCPRCTGVIKQDWLYCRNSVNHWRNLCGWKPGRSTKGYQTERYISSKGLEQVISPEEKGTPYEPIWEECEDSDRP